MKPRRDPDSRFVLSRPDAIQAALLELIRRQPRIVARHASGRRTAIEILAADAAMRRVYWRACERLAGGPASRGFRSLMAGAAFTIDARGYGGTVVRFVLDRPVIVYSDQGEPALASPWPEEVVRIQRRRSFRAQAAALPGALARWTPEGGRHAVVMRIRNVSVHGLGLHADLPAEVLPPVGAILRGVVLDFGDYGRLTADLTVRNARPAASPLAAGEAGEPAGPPAGGAAPGCHLGVSFDGLPPRDESWLQRMVWQAERLQAGAPAR